MRFKALTLAMIGLGLAAYGAQSVSAAEVKVTPLGLMKGEF